MGGVFRTPLYTTKNMKLHETTEIKKAITSICYGFIYKKFRLKFTTSCRPYDRYLIVFIELIGWDKVVTPHFIPLGIKHYG